MGVSNRNDDGGGGRRTLDLSQKAKRAKEESRRTRAGRLLYSQSDPPRLPLSPAEARVKQGHGPLLLTVTESLPSAHPSYARHVFQISQCQTRKTQWPCAEL